MSDKVLSTKIAKDYNSAQIQELNDVRQFLRIHRIKHSKYKILYDAVQEYVSSSSNSDSELKTKIKSILLSHSCAQVLPLENANAISQDASTLLGISSSNTVELNYNEALKLKKYIITALQEKYANICKEFSKITHQNVSEALSVPYDCLDFNLSNEEYGLLEFKKKLTEQQNQYLLNLLEEQKILHDITKLRLEDLPVACNKKIKEYETKSHMNALRTKILQEKTRLDIFMETDNSLKAYDELIKDIQEQQEECRNDINHLKKLKEKYNQVACKQFSDLLRSYTQYKTSLEKKKLIYESLKS